MRFFIWTMGAALMLLSASCDLLNPTSNQATVQASNQYGNSHTLNFSTSGTCGSPNCVFSNGSSSQSVNFNTVGGKIYVGSVKQNGSSCNSLIESGP
jgi:hypothetical protein